MGFSMDFTEDVDNGKPSNPPIVIVMEWSARASLPGSPHPAGELFKIFSSAVFFL
jgi:hypothetical protein